MIPLKFGLFWSGAKMSYLRFLTFVSLRKAHPHAEIELYWSNKSDNSVSWRIEKQDFQSEPNNHFDYISELDVLNVRVIKSELFPTYAPNYQSDFFRWWWLYNNGGFYLDTDQIILKSFDTLPLDCDLIYSMYSASSCGIYSPVGVIGSKKNCPIVRNIMEEMADLYDPSDYNSLGPFMFRDVFLKHKSNWEKNYSLFNSPPHIFYPISESYMVDKLYDSITYISPESYALHWYGGHPKSQEFNKRFSLGSESNSTISLLEKDLRKYWENLRK